MTKEYLLEEINKLNIDYDVSILQSLLKAGSDKDFKGIKLNLELAEATLEQLYTQDEDEDEENFDASLINEIKRIAVAKLLNLAEEDNEEEDDEVKYVDILKNLPIDLTTLYSLPLSDDAHDSPIFSKPNPEDEEQELAIRVLRELVLQGHFINLLMKPTDIMLKDEIDAKVEFLKILFEKTEKFDKSTLRCLFSPEKVGNSSYSYLKSQSKLLSFFEALQVNSVFPLLNDTAFVTSPCDAALTLDFLTQAVSQGSRYFGKPELIEKFTQAVNAISTEDIVTSVNVRGEGNCYYRAVMIGMLEQMVVAENRAELFNNLAQKLEVSLNNTNSLVKFPDEKRVQQQDLIRTLRKAANGECWNSPQDLKRDLLFSGEKTLDYALVTAARYLVAQRIQQLESEGHLPGSIILDSDTYYQDKILNNEEYATHEIFGNSLLADSLGVPIRLMHLEETDDDVKLNTYPDALTVDALDSKNNLKVNVLLFREHNQILRSVDVDQKIFGATDAQNEARLRYVKQHHSEPDVSIGFIHEENPVKPLARISLPELIKETQKSIESTIVDVKNQVDIAPDISLSDAYKNALTELVDAKTAFDESSKILENRGVLTWIADRIDRARAKDPTLLIAENTRLKQVYEEKLERENELYLAQNRYDALQQQLDIINSALTTTDEAILRKQVEAAKELSDYISLIPSVLARRPANVGFKERADDSSIKTRVVYNVKNREAEAKAAMEKIKPIVSDLGSVTASLGAVGTPSAPVVFRNEHIGTADILQTIGSLPGGSTLYIEKDNKNTVCNRSQFTSTSTNLRDDVIQAAFEQAELILSNYNEKSGPITITAKGKLGGVPSDQFASILHAALLVLGKDMKYLKINNLTVGPKPQAGWLYGESKQAFIEQQLLQGITDKALRQAKLEEYSIKHKGYASVIGEIRTREQAAIKEGTPLKEGSHIVIKPKM